MEDIVDSGLDAYAGPGPFAFEEPAVRSNCRSAGKGDEPASRRSAGLRRISNPRSCSWSATVSTSPSTIAICRRSGFSMTSDFGRYIDHTLLRPTARPHDVRRFCTEAIELRNGRRLHFPVVRAPGAGNPRSTRVKIATVIAFPFGVTFTEIKEAEMRPRPRRAPTKWISSSTSPLLKSGDDAS